MMPSGHGAIYACTTPLDMRKGFDSIATFVQDHIQKNPFNGSWYVFRNRKGDRVKILYWDGSGLVLYYKRLDEGSFHWPQPVGGVLKLTPSELGLLIDGVDWRRLALPQRKAPEKAA